MNARAGGEEERRCSPRLREVEVHGVVSVRVRPGIQATLLDISSSGAAFETSRRLLPGRHVHVQLSRAGEVTTLRARVTRNDVSWLTAGLIVYRCAVQFDRPWQVGR